MSPQIATFLCACLIVYLFWADRNQKAGASWASWIPFFWMFFAGSKYLTQWLNIGGATDTLEAYHEGNPINMVVFLGLIVAGTAVLLRRRLNWGRLLIENKWIALFFLFGAISILWSEYPFISFRRLIKAMGNVVMALVILTEERPYISFGVIVRRLAYLLLPLSVLFIKYYPEIGRAYHHGMPMFIGVSTGKNGLGQTCLLTGFFLCWSVLLNYRDEIKIGGSHRILIDFLLIAVIAWLLYMSNSATSIACLFIGIIIMLISRLPALSQKPKRIIHLGIACVAVLAIMEWLFDIQTTVLSALGRDATLTTRVPMWDYLLAMVHDPIFGFGYESFWLGERQAMVRERWAIYLSAHNGYLEVYLNLGLVGLSIIVGIIMSGLYKVSKILTIDYKIGILRIIILAIVVLYNWTEAIFYGVNNLWLLLYLSVMDIPLNKKSPELSIKNVA